MIILKLEKMPDSEESEEDKIQSEASKEFDQYFIDNPNFGCSGWAFASLRYIQKIGMAKFIEYTAKESMSVIYLLALISNLTNIKNVLEKPNIAQDYTRGSRDDIES